MSSGGGMVGILSSLIDEEVSMKAEKIVQDEKVLHDLKRDLLAQRMDVEKIRERIEQLTNEITQKSEEIRRRYDRQLSELYDKEQNLRHRLEEKYGFDVDGLAEIIRDIQFLEYLLSEARDDGCIYLTTEYERFTRIAYGYVEYIQFTTVDEVRNLIDRLKKRHGITDEMIKDFDEYLKVVEEIRGLLEDEKDDTINVESTDELVKLLELEEKAEAIESAIEMIDRILEESDYNRKLELCRELIYHVNNYKLV